MISRLTGKIVYATPRFFVIDVNGIGYKVYTTAGVLEKNLTDMVTFWTYLAVREDALDLYGFPNKDELDFFELLITVSSIGPKTALGILNVANPATIRKAVVTEDPAYLTKTSGISKKTAEKIVLELKDKLKGMDTKGTVALMESDNEIYDALIGLGYASSQAKAAIAKIKPETKSTNDRIREALRIIKS